MIVKNESKIIARAIDSVLGIIDSWCIVDTGSSDNTVEIIREKLSHLPGEILIRPWKNFGHNRTEAFLEAKKWGDWILLIDADMQLIDNSFDRSHLNPEVSGYQLLQKNSSLTYYNTRILNSKFDWECIGVTHEYFSVNHPSSLIEKLDSLIFNDVGDGGSKGDKFERDIRLLTKGLEEEPNNVRYMFYLAQSYKDTDKFNEAIKWYTKRIDSGGWREEVWYSHYMISWCYIQLKQLDKAEEWVHRALNYYSGRSEAIYELCKTHRILGNHQKAYEFYLLGKDIPYPKDDVLFISHEVYNGLFEYELTILHYYLFPNDRFEGLRKSFNYFSKTLNQNVYSNFKFYLTRLTSYSPEITELSSPTAAGFCNTSPCNLRTSSGIEIINVRQVNYKIDRSAGSYHYISDGRDMSYENTLVDPITTKNYLLGSGEMTERYEVTKYDNSTIIGLEDVRLFESDAVIKFLATTRNLNKDYKNRIATGTYDILNRKIIVEQVFDSPLNSDCEKNWVALNSDSLIYSWHPLRIYSYPDLKLIRSINTPNLFSHFRGSSNPVKHKGLNWFVVHSVIYETPRTYLHYLIALDDLGTPVLYSLPFSFEGEKIEYCLGIDIQSNMISFYYSTWDSSSKKMTLPLSVFKDSILLV